MSSRNRTQGWRFVVPALALSTLLVAHAELPEFLQHAISGSTIEAALYRMMQLPGGNFLYPRPPKEAQAELGKLLKADPGAAELYSLRAMTDEQALDFTAAEGDWQAYAAHATDKGHAELQLADFYARRVQPQAEVHALMKAAKAPSAVAERFMPANQQASWQNFARTTRVASKDDLPPDVTRAAYEAWWTRYPHEPAVPQMLITGPLDKLKLRHQHRLKPPAFRHLSRRQSRSPATGLLLR